MKAVAFPANAKAKVKKGKGIGTPLISVLTKREVLAVGSESRFLFLHKWRVGLGLGVRNWISASTDSLKCSFSFIASIWGLVCWSMRNSL